MMNQLAIGISYNQKRFIIGAQWPTVDSIWQSAKYKIEKAFLNIGATLFPMPAVV
jgi:hypothetical protein